MVDDHLRVQTKSYWGPTRTSIERLTRAKIEFSLNQRSDKMPRSIAEISWSTGSVSQAMSIVPSGVVETVVDEMRRLLRPWPEGRYTEAYDRSGGVLNLLTPPWGEEQDEVWKAMLAESEVEGLEGAARQEALRALEHRWNTTPHPFFAGLTPAQVMVGGGSREAELAEVFLARLAAAYDGHGFESEGQALIESLTLLREWQYQSEWRGQTLVEIIAAERDELLARRAQALAERGQAEDTK